MQTTIEITTDDGETDHITIVGNQDPVDALDAHGYDSDTVSYTVHKSDSERLNDLEAAAGLGKDGPKRGIAHRIDDLEDRIDALENGE